jgi:hypothetical protein
MVSSKIPKNSEERKRLLQSFIDLPLQEKMMFYNAFEHLRWLTILWDLEELKTDSLPSTSEKRHILLAYKLLNMLWFDKLPDLPDQVFTISVRDRLPDDQSPESINKTFDSSAEELADLCEEMPSPKWLNNATAVKTSIESFPQRSP